MNTLKELQNTLEPLKKKLYTHPLYNNLNSLEALKFFMSYHVFIVWDFMNLLSHLQDTLTCTKAPWSPKSSPKIRRLINSIKLEEESDIIDEEETSHFEYYLKSMKKLKVSTNSITTLLKDLQTIGYKKALNSKKIPQELQSFLKTSKFHIEKGIIQTASNFTFARETVISEMFINILSNCKKTNATKPFLNYLERHIALDGEEHSHLALELIDTLCENNPQKLNIAYISASEAIQARIQIYTEINKKLKNEKNNCPN